MENKKYQGRFWAHVASVPFIYIVIIPFVLLDTFLELYHRVCFSLYQIPFVKRSEYIKIDRHKLSYLNYRERLNCVYCGYANGLLHYASEITARTEEYWCGIKHSDDQEFRAPKHHEDFLEYGDRESFERLYGKKEENQKQEEYSA
jgi:hypothetical protein